MVVTIFIVMGGELVELRLTVSELALGLQDRMLPFILKCRDLAIIAVDIIVFMVVSTKSTRDVLLLLHLKRHIVVIATSSAIWCSFFPLRCMCKRIAWVVLCSGNSGGGFVSICGYAAIATTHSSRTVVVDGSELLQLADTPGEGARLHHGLRGV